MSQLELKDNQVWSGTGVIGSAEETYISNILQLFTSTVAECHSLEKITFQLVKDTDGNQLNSIEEKVFNIKGDNNNEMYVDLDISELKDNP